MNKFLIVFFSLIFLPFFLNAKIFEITCTGTGCTIVANMLQNLENQVNENFPDVDTKTFMGNMSNASVIVNKGGKADYATNLNVFLIGINSGLGMDLGDYTINQLIKGDIDKNKLPGVGAGANVLLGLNLQKLFLPKIAFLDLSKLRAYVNFMSYSLDKKLEDNSEASFDIRNFGVHLQYTLIPKKFKNPFFYWGGLYVMTGFDYSYLKAAIQTSFSEEVVQDISGQNVKATIVGQTTLGGKISTFSIPIEASTNIRLLSFLSLYSGLGLDLNFGRGEAFLDGATLPVNFTNLPGGVTATALGSLKLADSKGPDSLYFRGFIGTQFNIFALRIFVQAQKAFTDNLVALNFGANIAW